MDHPFCLALYAVTVNTLSAVRIFAICMGEYTGCTVNFKTYTKSLKFKKRMENPKENQRVFEDTQPAIIERGQWERVQVLRANKRRPTKTGKTSIFSGLVYCADCGAKLYYCTCNTYKDDSQDHFVCSNYKSNTGSCKIHYIREVTLYRRVLECIQGTLKLQAAEFPPAPLHTVPKVFESGGRSACQERNLHKAFG